MTYKFSNQVYIYMLTSFCYKWCLWVVEPQGIWHFKLFFTVWNIKSVNLKIINVTMKKGASLPEVSASQSGGIYSPSGTLSHCFSFSVTLNVFSSTGWIKISGTQVLPRLRLTFVLSTISLFFHFLCISEHR